MKANNLTYKPPAYPTQKQAEEQYPNVCSPLSGLMVYYGDPKERKPGDYPKGTEFDLTLVMTNRCNLNCSYCYVKKEKESDLSVERAMEVFSFIWGRNPSTINVTFFGGEPLLCKEKIEEICTKMELINKPYQVRLTFKLNTNGTLLDTPTLEMIDHHRIQLVVSDDGPMGKALQSEKKGAPPDVFATIEITVDPHCVGSLAETVQAIGNRRVIFSFNTMSQDWNDENLEILQSQLHAIAEAEVARIFEDDMNLINILQFKDIVQQEFWKQKPPRCGRRKHQMMVLGSDGIVYPCLQYWAHELPAKKLEIRHFSECETCSFSSRCPHPCACQSLAAGEDVDTFPSAFCAIEKILITEADYFGELLFQKDPERFFNFNFPILEK